MSFLVDENFGKVKAKHSSEEALQRWRDCCSVVKNSKRRFRFTANLSKRYEAADMRQTNKVLSLLIFLLNHFFYVERDLLSLFLFVYS